MLLKLDDHGKILQSHGKLLEQILMSSVRDSTLPLRDTLLLGQYQFSTHEKTMKRKREEEDYGGSRVSKTDIVFFNQEEVVGEAYQTKESKEEVEQSKEEEDVDEASQLILIESKVDLTLKKRHALTDAEINERAFKMACRMNQLHAHLDDLLPGVLLKSFIQRPISQDKKNQVDQGLSLRKDELSPKVMKNNTTTYKKIGEETVYLNALYTLYSKQWLDNE
ncbi:hypothetical protein GIB67_027660, partial [Kingdonia uniflora]